MYRRSYKNGKTKTNNFTLARAYKQRLAYYVMLFGLKFQEDLYLQN